MVLFVDGIIGGFFRDMDVMRMTFFQRSRRNLDKFGSVMQLGDRRASAISHAGTDTAD